MSKRRITGGILVGFGTVLGGAGVLTSVGIMPLRIDFFGINLASDGERIVWIIAWSLAVVVGVVLLRADPATQAR